VHLAAGLVYCLDADLRPPTEAQLAYVIDISREPPMHLRK